MSEHPPRPPLPPPTAAFLDELRERARRYGWDGDYVEIDFFLRSLYSEAGLPVPDLNPYLIEDES
jgi:hypothetical protein